MKKVILTGASGFVGRQVITSLLERDYEVHAVSHNLPPVNLISKNLFWHEANLLEFEDVEKLTKKVKATHLLHFAWFVEHGKFWNAPENEIWVEASLNLLKNFRECGGERVVASGTCFEYSFNDEVLSEEKSRLIPQTIYGKCKLDLQKSLSDFDISWAWGRIFFLYGEYESPKRLIASVIRSLVKDEFAHCSHGNQIRDFLYVKDAADAFAALLDSEVEGCVNVASGEGIKIKEMVLQVAKQLDKRENVRFGVIDSPPDEPQYIVADTERLRAEVEWKPKHTLLQGIEETIKFWKDYEIND